MAVSRPLYVVVSGPPGSGKTTLPGQIIEVFCRCEREVALARYRERSEHRHRGHFDERRADDDLWNDEVTTPVAGEWAVLEVDTNQPVDTSAVISQIRRLVEPH